MKWAFIAGAVDGCDDQNKDELDTVDDDFRGGAYPGVRMYINGGKVVVEIG